MSFIHGIIPRLWLQRPGKAPATTQFVLHQAVAPAMCAGLLLLYGGVLPKPASTSLLGVDALGVLLSALLMIRLVGQ